MPAFTKRKTKLHLQLTNSDQATAHGGQVLVDALARRFGLWKRIQEEPQLEVRKRLGAGFSPVGIIAQLLFTFTQWRRFLGRCRACGKRSGAPELAGLG
jgi:hypothetical protein